MSKLLSNTCFILFLICYANSTAQDVTSPKPEKNVPAIVLENFKAKFPSHDPVWFSQYQGRYNQKLVFEGKFIFDKRYSSAVYDNDGNLIAFAATIEKSEIPNSILNYMETNYPFYPIIEALSVSRGRNDQTYEIGIYIDGQYVIQIFSSSGNFIKSTKA